MFSINIKEFSQNAESLNFYADCGKYGRKYKETDATLNDIENDKDEIDEINKTLRVGKGNKGYIQRELLKCQENYTAFIKCVERDVKAFRSNILEHSLCVVAGLIDKRITEIYSITISPEEDEQINPKYWKVKGKNGDKNILEWSAESYNKNALAVLKDKFIEWEVLTTFFLKYYEAEKLLKASKDFLNGNLKPLITDLSKDMISAPVADNIPVPTTPDVVPSDSEFKDKPYWENLVPVLDEFSLFEKHLPILMACYYITESRDKVNPHLVWRKDQISFAKYFRTIKNDKELPTRWSLLKPLFNREIIGKPNSLKRSALKEKNKDCSDVEAKLGIILDN